MTLILAVIATATVFADNHPDIGSIKWNNDINAYEINSVANLNDLANYVNGNVSYDCSGMTFKMTKDITYTYTHAWNVTSTDNNYTPIGHFVRIDDYVNHDYLFKGHFNGDGHTIKGIRINRSVGDSGLFGRIGDGAVVENITLDDARITDENNTGGIAGYNAGTISNCHVTDKVAIHALSNNQGDVFYHGGIVGYNHKGSVKYCSSAVTLTQENSTSSEFGAIAGYNDNGTLSYNLAVGASIPKTTDNSTYGAITGENYGSLDHNYYSNCKIGSSSVTPSGVGCGNSTSSPSDITASDGAVGVTNAIILSDTKAVPSPLSGKVFYIRDFKIGVASTICLPFSYTPANDEGNYYTFTGITKKTENNNTTYEATMTQTASTLGAGTPYLFLPAKTPIFYSYEFTSSTPVSPGSYTSGGWIFKGTYNVITWESEPETPTYGFSAQTVGDQNISVGQFVRVGNYVKIRSLRAYLEYSGSNFPNTRGTLSEEELPDRILVRLVDSNGDITGIGELDMKTGDVTFDSNWYTLEGVRLSGKPSKRGVYVNNGRKYIIK